MSKEEAAGNSQGAINMPTLNLSSIHGMNSTIKPRFQKSPTHEDYKDFNAAHNFSDTESSLIHEM